MAKQCAGQAERAAKGFAGGAWAHTKRRKAAAYEALGAQPFAVASAPGATPAANTVKAMLSGVIPVEVDFLVVRIAELARGGTNPIAEYRRAFDRERKHRASTKGPPTESQHAPPPPELHEKPSVVAMAFASNRGTSIPTNWVPDEKWLPSLAENDGVMS